jgi:hypothetical protein
VHFSSSFLVLLVFIFCKIVGFLCWFQGKRLVFVTNNSTKSRKQYGKKFETLGLDVSEVSKSQPFLFYSFVLFQQLLYIHPIVSGRNFRIILCSCGLFEVN